MRAACCRAARCWSVLARLALCDMRRMPSHGRRVLCSAGPRLCSQGAICYYMTVLVLIYVIATLYTGASAALLVARFRAHRTRRTALASKDLTRLLPRLHPLAPPLGVLWCWQRALSLWLSDGVLPLAAPLARANGSLLNGQRPPRTVRTSSPWKRNCRTSEAVLRARAPRARQLPRARTQQRWQT